MNGRLSVAIVVVALIAVAVFFIQTADKRNG
jgi:hypothetical protein